MIGRGEPASDPRSLPPRESLSLSYLIPNLGIGLFAVAAFGDVRTRRIPNALVASVAALGLVRLMMAGDPGAAIPGVVTAAVVLAVGFLLFWWGLIGGGDAKLAAAAVLLLGHHAVSEFIVTMSLAGLVVSLAVFVNHWLKRRANVPPQYVAADARLAQPTVPYGVAIAAAGILILALQSAIPLQFSIPR